MPEFLRSTIQVLVGIAFLFGGGELFVQGSVALAVIFGIPQLVIGLTVVSLGTSAPELFVSLNSVLQGSDALALSNVVGSNIFNVMVVLGSSALVLPLHVESRLVRRDVPLMIAVSAAVWGMASAGRVTWQAGLSLVLGLMINTIWAIRTAREQLNDNENVETEIEEDKAEGGWNLAAFQLIGGIAVLTIGSRVLVHGATSVVSLLGVSEEVIGLTIVSAGTSMPELITSLVAALRGRTDLAIGNVVGSCLLNLMLVLGGTALFATGRGLNVTPELINEDLPVMLLTSLACLPIFWTRGQISRLEGGLLLGLYGLYLIDNVLPRTQLSNWTDEFRLVMLCLVLPTVVIMIAMQALIYWRNTRSKIDFPNIQIK
ncbi:calcium/sodium antiporter [Synechococcus sp. M16CYN]|uniref:calcium/sodium antiporter n=1 Tax=Synechococcus sp. M16CYN TaxID=3103139 RepID=UPI003256991F